MASIVLCLHFLVSFHSHNLNPFLSGKGSGDNKSDGKGGKDAAAAASSGDASGKAEAHFHQHGALPRFLALPGWSLCDALFSFLLALSVVVCLSLLRLWCGGVRDARLTRVQGREADEQKPNETIRGFALRCIALHSAHRSPSPTAGHSWSQRCCIILTNTTLAYLN